MIARTKPYYTLRTHPGVPRSPVWAKGFRLLFRAFPRTRPMHISALKETSWRWSFHGTPGDIVAVEWIP